MLPYTILESVYPLHFSLNRFLKYLTINQDRLWGNPLDLDTPRLTKIKILVDTQLLNHTMVKENFNQSML